MPSRIIGLCIFAAIIVLLALWIAYRAIYYKGFYDRGKNIDTERKDLENDKAHLKFQREEFRKQQGKIVEDFKKQKAKETKELADWKNKETKELAERKAQQDKKESALHERETALDERAKRAAAFEKLMSDTRQNSPWLAKKFADFDYICDCDSARHLETKSRPAFTAAAEVRSIAREKRGLVVENKLLQYQLDFYEEMFPWLLEFKEVPIQEAVAYARSSEGSEEYDSIRNWLSPEEYGALDDAHKFQLALDRWRKRNKTSWEIGIDFERYVGYQLELKGYKVKYFGATMGLEDMGRDLLATKDGLTLVIQCKRWAKEKTIHEKHICQLYGSVAVLSIQNPSKKYKGVFITTTKLSPVASDFAKYSDISIVENCEVGDYPVIKCNISKDGEKIYHLPFDQQYDRVEISLKKGECYAITVEEAENKGFRRAFRWHSS